jgi:hypothetical protein
VEVPVVEDLVLLAIILLATVPPVIVAEDFILEVTMAPHTIPLTTQMAVE